MGPEGGAHALGHEMPGALEQPDDVLDVLRTLPTRPPIEATRCGAEDEKAREAHENVRANEFRVLAAPVPIRSPATSPSPSQVDGLDHSDHDVDQDTMRTTTDATTDLEATIDREVSDELCRLAAVHYRAGGSFCFIPINVSNAAKEHMELAKSVATASYSLIPRSTGTPTFTESDAVTIMAAGVATVRGGYTYPWQEPPLYKAVLEARLDELREKGLSVFDDTLTEWNALIAALDTSLRIEVAKSAPPKSPPPIRWGWRNRHRKTSSATSEQTLPSEIPHSVHENAVVKKGSDGRNSVCTPEGEYDVYSDPAAVHGIKESGDTNQRTRQNSIATMISGGWMDVADGLLDSNANDNKFYIPRGSRSTEEGADRTKEDKDVRPASAVLIPVGAGFGTGTFRSPSWPLLSPLDTISGKQTPSLSVIDEHDSSQASYLKSHIEETDNKILMRKTELSAFRRAVSDGSIPAYRGGGKCDNATEDAQLTEHLSKALSKLLAVQHKLDRELKLASDFIRLRGIMRGYQELCSFTVHQERLQLLLREAASLGAAAKRSGAADPILGAAQALMTLELQRVNRLVADVFQKISEKGNAANQKTSPAYQAVTPVNVSEVHPMHQLYRVVLADLSMEAATTKPQCRSGGTATEIDWVIELERLEVTRRSTSGLIHATRSKLEAEKNLQKLHLRSPRTERRVSPAQQRSWREQVFGVKAALAAAGEATAALQNEVNRLRGRYQKVYSSVVRTPSSNVHDADHLRKLAAENVVETTQTGMALFREMSCRLDGDEVGKWWDARLSDLKLNSELKRKEERLQLLLLVSELKQIGDVLSSDPDPDLKESSCDDNTNKLVSPQPDMERSNLPARREELLRSAYKRKLLYTAAEQRRQQLLQNALASRQRQSDVYAELHLAQESHWREVLSSRIDGPDVPDLVFRQCFDSEFGAHHMTLTNLEMGGELGSTRTAAWHTASRWCNMPAGVVLAHCVSLLWAVRQASWVCTSTRLRSDLDSGDNSRAGILHAIIVPSELVDTHFAAWCHTLSQLDCTCDSDIHHSTATFERLADFMEPTAPAGLDVGDNISKVTANLKRTFQVRSDSFLMTLRKS